MESEGNDTKTIEELQKEKARYEAETAKLEAEKARHEAVKAAKQAETMAEVADLEWQKAMADAQKELLESKAGLSTSRKLEDLKNKKAFLDAQKALAVSQKALDLAEDPSTQELSVLEQQEKLVAAQKKLADAQSQAAIANYIGTTKAGKFEGTVNVKETAGGVESNLLAARAVKIAGVKIATEVGDKTLGKKVLIFEADQFPDFQNLISFRFNLQIIKISFEAALKEESGDAKGNGVVKKPIILPKTGVTLPTIVSAGLEALSNILGHLKTDYTIGGKEVSINNSLLIYSVAGELAPTHEIYLPSLRNAMNIDETLTTFAAALKPLETMRSVAVKRANKLKIKIADWEQQAADKEGAAKESLADHSSNLMQLNDIIKVYDNLLSSLVTADDEGNVPLSGIVRDLAIERALKRMGDMDAILMLRVENSGGGYLLKKGLFTGLFGMPLYHMGGATVAYILLAGKTGKVLGGSVIPVHGGFVKSGKISQELKSTLL